MLSHRPHRVALVLLLTLAACALAGCHKKATPVTANFTASVRSGPAPLEVTFNDASRGNITWWEWELGDGTVWPGLHPTLTHTYEQPGVYTVCLMVMSCPSAVDCKRDWELKLDWIVVTEPVSARAEAPAEAARAPEPRALAPASEGHAPIAHARPGARGLAAASALAAAPARIEWSARCTHDQPTEGCTLADVRAWLVLGQAAIPLPTPECPGVARTLFVPARWLSVATPRLELLSPPSVRAGPPGASATGPTPVVFELSVDHDRVQREVLHLPSGARAEPLRRAFGSSSSSGSPTRCSAPGRFRFVVL